MFSLSAVLYLMVRALPRLADEPPSERRGFLDRWAHSDIPEKIDASWNAFWLKSLRRFKVSVSKLDNAVTARLHKISREKNEAKAIDFKDITETKQED